MVPFAEQVKTIRVTCGRCGDKILYTTHTTVQHRPVGEPAVWGLLRRLVGICIHAVIEI